MMTGATHAAPPPHGGVLVDRILTGEQREAARREAPGLARLDLGPGAAREVVNLARGILSPLEGLMARHDFEAYVTHGRLADGTPWTISIVLDVSDEQARRLGGRVALAHGAEPFALLDVDEVYAYDREAFAVGVFGTTDGRHPGVARVRALQAHLVGGRISVFGELSATRSRYSLTPRETRALFASRGWKTVVGFQTRNVPHVGHEYVQKTALSFVDGLFINPVIGKKKPGDFRDEAIIRCYEVLVEHYYPRDRVAMAILETDMRYAGPREAIFHAIVRKNFGCTHFIVGRDHAGVGSYYAPYAAQEIFAEFPDLGITPLFFTAFFHCRRCGSVANEKTCPHDKAERNYFSGTLLRDILSRAAAVPTELIRPEVAAALRDFPEPFVEAGTPG